MDQYEKQFMFGDPVPLASIEGAKDNSFFLVWSYSKKVADNRKKACCTMDGSARGGNVRILGRTYANCADHTGSRIFYASAAAENLVIFGSDVSNAFGEAPAPKQGAFLYPDRAFHQWWKHHKKRPPIPPGYVIPVQKAMQGHPESPRLWEKFIDGILKDIGLVPTVHEPCLDHGTIDGKRILFLHQVDYFACAAPDQHNLDLLLDIIDDRLSMPIKRS